MNRAAECRLRRMKTSSALASWCVSMVNVVALEVREASQILGVSEDELVERGVKLTWRTS